MINPKELLFVVDEQNNPIESKPRDETHLKDYWHRTTHIWIINKKRQILCQQRSPLKDKYPGFWEPFFGGHLAPNEDYSTCALKELYEELGIHITREELRYFDTIKNQNSYEFQCVFFHCINEENFILEKEEVTQVKWFNNKKLKDIVSTRKDGWVLPLYSSTILSWFESVNIENRRRNSMLEGTTQ